MIVSVMCQRSSFRAWLSCFASLAALTMPFDLQAAASRASRFDITSKGKPRAEIVVEEAAPDAPVAFAAQELQRYGKEVSGAELPIVPASSRKPAIVLAVRSLQHEHQAREDPREKDRYRLSVDARRLLIQGASARAVLFGVYRGIFGLNGYQGNGARDPESPTRPASGRYLEAQRPGQLAFLQGLLGRTTDPQIRRRLERALQPWSLWNHEPRFWAFPDFKDLH
jgi:hypothetical protein